MCVSLTRVCVWGKEREMDKHLFLIDCERELVLFFRKALTIPDYNVFRYSYPPSLWSAASLALKHYDTTERSQWLSLKTQYSYLSIVPPPPTHTHTALVTHHQMVTHHSATASTVSHCTEVEFHCPPSLFFCPHPIFCLSLHTHTHTHTHTHFLSLWMMSCSPVLNLLPYDMVSCSAENIKTDCERQRETQTDSEWQWKRHNREFNSFLSVSYNYIHKPALKPAHGNSKVRVTRVCACRWQQDSNYYFTHLGTCLVRCNLPNSLCNTVYGDDLTCVYSVLYRVQLQV